MDRLPLQYELNYDMRNIRAYRRSYDAVYLIYDDNRHFSRVSIFGSQEEHPEWFHNFIQNRLILSRPKRKQDPFQEDQFDFAFKMSLIKNRHYLVSFRPRNNGRDPQTFSGLMNIKRDAVEFHDNYNVTERPAHVVNQLRLAPDILRSERFAVPDRPYHEIRLANSLRFPNWFVRIVEMPFIKGPGKWYLVSLHPTQNDLMPEPDEDVAVRHARMVRDIRDALPVEEA